MRTRSPTQLVLGLVALAAVVVVGALLYGGVFGTAPASDGRPSPSPVEEREDPVLRTDEVALEPSPESVSRQNVPPALSMLLGPVYALRDPQGRILADVFVALCKRGEVLLSGRTDESGEFAHDPAAEGMGRLLVLAPGWVPQICEVPLEGGRHMVVLERGSVVSGRVLVSGEEPGERIPISLLSTLRPLSIEQELGFGWAQFELPANSGHWAVARTDEHGLFRFQGLPADWRGELRLPIEYRLEDQTLACSSHALNCFALDGPAEDLTIRAVKCLTLRGRVITYPKGNPVPVPGAVVLPDLVFPEGFEKTYLGEARADAEGRFTFVLPTPSIRGGRINIAPPGREYFREIGVEPVEVEDVLDLGDLALADRGGTQAVSLAVVEQDMDPIQGAVAAIDSGSAPSEPTDESGLTTLYGVVPGATSAAVYALGYETVEFFVPGEVPTELRVVMRPAAMLELRFLQPDGKPARGITARLSARENPLRSEALPRSYAGYIRTGCSYYRTFFPRDGGVVVRLNDLGEGRIVLNDIKPGVGLQLRVEGPFAGVIQEERIVELQPGEHRVQEVVLKRFAASFHGRVVDQAGEPLLRAMVSITPVLPDTPVPQARTISKGVDAKGNFSFETIYSPSIWFSAQAPGYTRYIVQEMEVPGEGAFLEVRLAPENVVTVTIEDKNGKRLPASSVRATLLSGVVVVLASKAAGQEGVYILRSLPDEEITITAYVYGIPYSQSHNPKEPECSITVPSLGEVRVKAHFFDELVVDDTWLLCLLPRWEPGPGIRYVRVRDSIIPGVLPGSYDVVMRRYPKGFEEMENLVETSNRVQIEVRASSVTYVEIVQQL